MNLFELGLLKAASIYYWKISLSFLGAFVGMLTVLLVAIQVCRHGT